MSESRVMRRRREEADAGWEGVEPRAYKDVPGSHRDVARHLLMGGELDAPGAPFEVRSFRVEPGGFTSQERHAHPHAVVVLAGRGSVRLGEGEGARTEALGPLDAVWVAPWEVHRFRAEKDEALTFLCVVPAERDRPQLIVEEAPE